MKIVNLDNISNNESYPNSLFTGKVGIQNAVTETEGVRNKLHIHTNDQILIVTKGKGVVATEKEEVEVKEGDWSNNLKLNQIYSCFR